MWGPIKYYPRRTFDGWEEWFAWRPVRVQTRDSWHWVWWELVERSVAGSGGEAWAIYRLPGTYSSYEYSKYISGW